MHPLRLDWNFVAKEPEPSGEPPDGLTALERAARIADVKDRLITCLEELDRLNLSYAAIYLSHALAFVDDEA